MPEWKIFCKSCVNEELNAIKDETNRDTKYLSIRCSKCRTELYRSLFEELPNESLARIGFNSIQSGESNF